MTSIFLHSACLLPRHSCPSDGSFLTYLCSGDASGGSSVVNRPHHRCGGIGHRTPIPHLISLPGATHVCCLRTNPLGIDGEGESQPAGGHEDHKWRQMQRQGRKALPLPHLPWPTLLPTLSPSAVDHTIIHRQPCRCPRCRLPPPPFPPLSLPLLLLLFG